MQKLRRNLALAGIGMTVSAAAADVRVVHASPDAPNVDVIVNDNFASPAFVNAPFTGVTSYADLPTGTYNFKVVPTGANAPVVIDATLPIDGALDYSIAATDILSEITPQVYIDDNTLDPANARVRFIHLAPNAPNVDIGLAGGGATLFPDVQFQENAGYISVAPGTFDLDVRLAGTSTVALSVPGLVLEANTVYTVYAMGLLGSTTTPLQAVVSVDAVPEPGSLVLLAAGCALLRRRR
jgi:hypothetical protein